MKLRLALAGLGTSALVILAGCGNGPPPDQASSSGGGSGGGGGGGSMQLVTSGTAAKTVGATGDNTFDPKTASVKVGDVIKWSNTGNVGHNVTFDAGPHSDTFSGGDAVMFKFTQAGTFAYHCTIHPGMDGSVTVGQ